jgi:hypothetical protein
VFPVHFAACAECSLEQIKSGLWPTHLFRQITGAVMACRYDGTQSSVNLIDMVFWGVQGVEPVDDRRQFERQVKSSFSG